MITKEAFEPSHIKKYRYFQKGVLAFEKSGHTLTRVRAYYVCSKKQKRQCKEPEIKTINAENLERRFSYLAQKFVIPEKYKETVIKTMFRDVIVSFLDNFLDSPDFSDLIGLTTDALKSEVKLGDASNFKGDVKTIKGQIEKGAERNTRPVVVPRGGSVTLALKGDVLPCGSPGATETSTHIFEIADVGHPVLAIGATPDDRAALSIVSPIGNMMTVVCRY